MATTGIELLTTAEVARQLGVAPRTIRDQAARHGLGTLLTARTLVFTPAEVERLRARVTGKRGRPHGIGAPMVTPVRR